MKGLVRGGVGAGSLETTKPKSVKAGIRWRGWWDVIGDGRDERELEVQVVEDTVMYGGEVLEFKLVVPCTKPFEKSNLVIMEERSLKDVCDPLTLLCVCQRVIDVTGNGGLDRKSTRLNSSHRP